MNEPDLKNQIHRYLCLYAHGASHAKTGKSIADQFHTNWRTVAAVIRQLRIDGVLIGSRKGNNRPSLTSFRELPGYYIPETTQEANDYLQTFKAELFDMLTTYNRQKKAKQRITENQKSEDLFYKTNASGQKELVLC
jgi:hypothetical protein